MSSIDFKPYFDQYEALVKMTDAAFKKVEDRFETEVMCHTGCSDCCHALFDLTLIEAAYISHHFHRTFQGKERDALVVKANRADRKIYKLKRNAHKALRDGGSEIDILGKMSMERVRCPLLNDKDRCDLYAYRPITCRVYGIPTVSGGVSHTCGKSGFVQGVEYPTVKLEQIQVRLYDLSTAFVKSIETRYKKMADMLVPLSMAVRNEYDEDYLGMTPEKTDDPQKREKGDIS